MITVPIYNMKGAQVGQDEIDPAVLGGEVRPALMKQAIVTYLDHQRLFAARTKNRSAVEGSTRKLYKQKGSGNARPGPIRTPIRRGGGRAHAKVRPNAHKEMPKKMRRLARNSALLAKFQANDVLIVDAVRFDEPKTRLFVSMLKALKLEKGCLLALNEFDSNTYLSSRNVQKVEVCLVDQLNTYEVLRRPKLVISHEAFGKIKNGESGFGL